MEFRKPSPWESWPLGMLMCCCLLYLWGPLAEGVVSSLRLALSLSLSLQASKLCLLSLLSLQASKQPISKSEPYVKLITLTSLFVVVAHHSVVAIMSGRNQHVQPTNQPPHVAASVVVLSLASEFNWNAKGLECSNVD